MAPRKAVAASTATATTKASAKTSTTKPSKAAETKKAATAKTSRSRKAPEPAPADEPEKIEGSAADETEAAEAPMPKKKVAAPKTKAASATKPPAKTKKAQTKVVDGHESEKEIASNSKSKKTQSSVAPKQEQAEKPKKRKQRDEDGHAPTVKKVRTAAVPTVGKPINQVPKDVLDIFVFGEGTSGELGLGSKKYEGKKPIDVKRPRLNHNLGSGDVGVVQIACGGMHVVALTHDQKILTWGVNDDRALGRDTTWEGGVRDIDNEESDDEDEDDTGINPNESTPGEVDFTDIALPGTKFVQVVATDSASFVLTEDGRVYGWGTFRGSDGIIGFSDDVLRQQVPIKIDGLKNITRLAAGANHVLALDLDGKVFSWGSGGQYQLGRKAITRGKNSGLKPEPCGKFGRKHHAVDIAAGSYHSFYIDNHGQTWAWGLNNYSQTGHSDDTGKDAAMVLIPKTVELLAKKKVVSIDGGAHHSLAATADGQLLTWGRVDGHQVGHEEASYNEGNTIFDDNGKPRILVEPTPIEGINATFVAAGTDNSFALTKDGQVYSWGFSANYQTGQGTIDDVKIPTLIDNSAIRGRKITWAGAGGQFSVLAATKVAAPNGITNGH